MGLTAIIILAISSLLMILVMLELILDSTCDISLAMLLYSLSYDFRDLEMKPMQITNYGNRRRYITISGIRNKRYGYEVSPININVEFGYNRFVFDSFKNNKLNLKTRTLIAFELLEDEREMRNKKFNELFDNLENENEDW